MADPVIVTTAPTEESLPRWLVDGWEKSATTFAHVPASGVIPTEYQMVELHDFILFGKNFARITYDAFDSPLPDAKKIGDFQGVGKGVGKELKALLVDAQRRAFQIFANRQLARGGEIGEDQFRKWCGLVFEHKGWQPRDGKHRLGCAVDIEPLLNPYVVTASRDRSVVGGELPTRKGDKPLGAGELALLDQTVRRPCVAAYDRAMEFTFGSSAGRAPMFAVEAGETSRDVSRRFRRVSFAVGVYMDVGFPAQKNSVDLIPKGVTVPPRSLDDMGDQLRRYKGTEVNQGTVALADNAAALAKFQKEMVADHAALRGGLINGPWSFIDNAQTGFDGTRDPRFGFLNIPEDLLVALLDARVTDGSKTFRMRWGATDFGQQQNGDMMHFDLGPERSDAVAKALPTVKNEKNIYIGKLQKKKKGS